MSFLPASIVDDLIAGGWLPAGAQPTQFAIEAGANLLPALLAAWDGGARQSSDTRPSSPPADPTASWIDQSLAAGAQLTWGFPNSEETALRRWLQARLIWWPNGVPAGHRVALVSSRLGRRVDQQRPWFQALRAACASLDRQLDTLVLATDTAAARYVQRAARLFEFRVIVITEPRDRDQLSEWLRKFHLAEPAEDQGGQFPAYVSPPPSHDVSPATLPSDLDQTPLRDRALVAAGNSIIVLRMRPGGFQDRLIRYRLNDATWPPKSVRVAIGEGLVSRPLANELLEAGAVGWGFSTAEPKVMGTSGAGRQVGGRSATDASCLIRSSPSAKIIRMPGKKNWEFLTHWTRAQPGPWPDQSEDDYLDELILTGADVDHSAWSALCRIVRQQTIIATACAIRGGSPVVSFTAVPLVELPRMRVFRPHRGRWDFEPYGICICRAWLQRRGASPVSYGDDADWVDLPPARRPFFQLRMTRSRRGRAPVDWTREQEWRHQGKVDLTDLAPDEGMLFVPTQVEAEQLARFSRWPVTVLNC